MILINYAITEADLLAIDIPTALQLNVYSGCYVESQLNQLLLMNFSIDNIWRITVFLRKKIQGYNTYIFSYDVYIKL